MGQISTLFVHKVVAAATAGLPDEARRVSLLKMVGIDPEAPVDPKLMIPDTAYYELCETVVRADPEGTSLPIRVGSSMRCDDYGAFGLAWKSALNLRGSYQRAERYGRVLTSVALYELLEEGDRAFMVLHRAGMRRLGLRISNEQTIVAVTQISREVFQEAFVPIAIHFRHPAPSDLSAHHEYFGCPVHYDSDRDTVEVSQAHLSARNRLGDASISAFLDAHMDQELANLPDGDGLDRRVRSEVSQSLSEGLPSVNAVAARLGLSGRTLQRRLAGQGLAFQDLVDQARQELAEQLLRRTDYALVEVAFLTGFTEQSAFTRAFKRWRGQTPSRFRQVVRAV